MRCSVSPKRIIQFADLGPGQRELALLGIARGLGDGLALSADDDLCRLPRVLFDGLPYDDAARQRAAGCGQASAKDPVERRGGRRGDSLGAGGGAIPRRRLSEAPSPHGPSGLAIGGTRVLCLMRGYQLLAPRQLGLPNGDPVHAGTMDDFIKRWRIRNGVTALKRPFG